MRKLVVGVVMLLAVAAVVGSAQAVVPGANGRIAFARAVCKPKCSSWSIVTANRSGTHQHVVAGPYPSSAFDNHFIANWSPNGHELVFMVHMTIWKVNADGSGLRVLFRPRAGAGAGADDGPTFTPDGKHIIFSRCCLKGFGQSLWMINAKGGGLTDLTKEPGVNGNGPADTTPQVSPDGKTIVFNRCFPNAPCVVATVRINGTNLHDLTDNSKFATVLPNWSPDGSKIVFEMDPPHGSPRIATINADGSGLKELTFTGPHVANLQPSYAPDGKKIIFVRVRAGRGGLFTMKPNGRGIRQITSTVNPELYPQWAAAP